MRFLYNIKRSIRNWLRDDGPEDSVLCYPNKVGLIRKANTTIDTDGLNFRVFVGLGGKIIEFQKYDSKADRHNTSLHVIPDRDDFSQRIGEIVMLEVLRNS